MARKPEVEEQDEFLDFSEVGVPKLPRKSKKKQFTEKVVNTLNTRKDINPFLERLKIIISRKSKLRDEYLAPDEEITPEQRAKGDSEVVFEKYNNIKLFVKKGYFQQLRNLDNYGLWVLQYVHYSMHQYTEPNVLWVKIDRKECSEFTGLNVKYVGQGIQKLKECFFLADSEVQGIYHINPRYFFYGNRIKALPDKLHRKPSEKKSKT